jgi:enoyl-CoA hydratase
LDLGSFTTLKFERQGRVLKVYFNNPSTLNAIDQAAHSEVVRFFAEVATDTETDVVILSGMGRAFSAGGDFDHIQRMIDQPVLFTDSMYEAKRLILTLLDCPKPVIAKVNGHAIGLGATIALFCDVIFASMDAKIGDPHVRIGLVAGDGGAAIWPHLIGHVRAKEYLLTGRPLTAVEAERIGLINQAVPPAELDRVVDDYVVELQKSPARAVQWTKLSVNAGLKQTVNAVLEASMAYEALSNLTDDHREAVSAVREKREPNFTGN